MQMHRECAGAEPYIYPVGAVAVRLLMYDTSISLINCHLSKWAVYRRQLKKALRL